MAEERIPLKTAQTQPVEPKTSGINNDIDFWTEIKRLKEDLAECRRILAEQER